MTALVDLMCSVLPTDLVLSAHDTHSQTSCWTTKPSFQNRLLYKCGALCLELETNCYNVMNWPDRSRPETEVLILIGIEVSLDIQFASVANIKRRTPAACGQSMKILVFSHFYPLEKFPQLIAKK